MKFSGHETFIARNYWPKKGYDFINRGYSFTQEDAVVKLGVGRNMVTSINYWMKALGLSKQDKPTTQIADFLFGNVGRDPYLEDIASIWLLHYYLVTTNHASIYNAVFNKFRKERTSFTKEQLKAFLQRLIRENGENHTDSTIEKDISIFSRLYNTPDYRAIKKDYEDEITSLMLELELMSSTKETVTSEKGKKSIEWYYLNSDNRNNLPCVVSLFAILDQNEGSNNISFRRLEIEENNPGLVFMLNKDGLYDQLKKIEELVPEAMVKETAGNINLLLPDKLDKWKILEEYYEK